ncbi:hypothetical protein KSP40_PGU015803 [Platanthera guangdongensis]|uniref:Uncharacterized protein n=1 Tax=Platanthera guangdongensis TaxID=2320717 RepID=A0ABR2LGF4_9ASPA
MAGRDDGRPDYASGRLRGGSIPSTANGQGKPKKGGRISFRDGKRIRSSNEQDIDDEDDADLSLR